MSVWSPTCDLYEKRPRGELAKGSIPRHTGVIPDGNRRWTKSVGVRASQGHHAGADKISELLGQVNGVRVEIVTLWMLSTDSLSCSSEELGESLGIIAGAINHLVAQK